MTDKLAQQVEELDTQVQRARIRWIRVSTAFAEFLICLFVREAVRRLLD